MSTGYHRQHPELPDHELLYDAGLGFISEGGTYTPAEIRQAVAVVYDIPSEHLALRLAGGSLAYNNYFAQVLRKFTINKFHIRHGHGDNAIYAVTPAGVAAGQSVVG